MESLLIWSASSARGQQNLEHGLSTHTWGFRRLDTAIRRGRAAHVIFGSRFSGGNVRVDSEYWATGNCSLLIGEISSPVFEGRAPHWPDEIDQNSVIYPWRFGFTPLGWLHHVPLSGTSELPLDVAEHLRLAAVTNDPQVVQFQPSDLLARMGVQPSVTGGTDLSSTAGTPVDPTPALGSRSQGRSTDNELTGAVEAYAVLRASEHMRRLGYDVRELGKPFDLVCTSTDGREKHVEVKGTTGAGAQVIYTPNEVQHFRQCPYGADLIVVRDIQLDRSAVPYQANGGTLLHVENYTAPPDDLQATGWAGRVSGWDDE